MDSAELATLGFWFNALTTLAKIHTNIALIPTIRRFFIVSIRWEPIARLRICRSRPIRFQIASR
eukprot:344259-Amorphochlora_amoeboformis.AAC.1